MKITDGRGTSGMYRELKSKGYGIVRTSIREKADREENFDMIKSWLKQCTENHKSCLKHEGDETFLPTRLIEIGPENDAALLQPRLVMSSSLDLKTPYYALSYCWGTDHGKTVQKTTRDNLPLHLKIIEITKLCKTYIDAMEIVRKLGYRYIWIDALCIIQDDRSDFEVEYSRMNQIYSRAYCALVAADSPGGDGGCFVPRNTEGVTAATYHAVNKRIPYYPTGIMDVIRGRFETDPDFADVTIYLNFGPWIKSINQGPVFRRGWCIQE